MASASEDLCFCTLCDADIRNTKKVAFSSSLQDVDGSVISGLLELFPLQLSPVKMGRGQCKRYLCRTCFFALSTAIRKKRCLEERMSNKSFLASRKRGLTPQKTSTPKKKRQRVCVTPMKVSSPRGKKQQGKRDTFLTKAMALMASGSYLKGLKHLISNSYKACVAFRSLVKQQARFEREGYSMLSESLLTTPLSRSAIEKFSWDDVCRDLQINMPVLFEAIQGTCFGTKKRNVRPAMGLAVSMLLYVTKPKKWKFLPALMGVMLYRGGCAQKLFMGLHKFGLCQTYKTALVNIDRICKDATSELKKWKAELEGKDGDGPDEERRDQHYESSTNDEEHGHSEDAAVDVDEQRGSPLFDADSLSASGQQTPPLSLESESLTALGQRTAALSLDTKSLQVQRKQTSLSQETDSLHDQGQHTASPSLEAGFLSASRNPTSSISLDAESRTLSTPRQRQLFADDKSSDDDVLAMELEKSVSLETKTSYAMCYDNVGIVEKARHQGKKSSTVHVWTSAYAAEDRVHFEPGALSETIPAIKLPLQTFLPSHDDLESRRSRMTVIIKRILVSHLDYFSSCCFEDSIEHTYSKEMKEKSNIITIGIIPYNPGTTEGAFQVLDKLHKFVPFPDGVHMPPKIVPVHGDAGSVLGMLSSKRSRACSETPNDRLEGIWPVPGEFHRRILLNQDTMNIFFRDDTRGTRGTLSNIASVFSMKGVKPKVSDAFNHDEDLIYLTTKGLVCLTAMKLLKIESCEETSSLQTEQLEDKLNEVATKITTFFWHQTPMSDIMNVIEADSTLEEVPFCTCRNKIDVAMVECANTECRRGRWFHLGCVGLEEAPELEWFCSKDCEESGGSGYCLCRRKKDEERVECQAGLACDQGRFFHLSCVGYVKDLIEPSCTGRLR